MAVKVRKKDISIAAHFMVYGLAVIFLLGLAGCAKTTVKSNSSKDKQAPAPSVKMDEGEGLTDLRSAIKTPEDAQILDLLISYRMLMLKHPDPKSLDKETLNKGRQAFEKLESALRHGGIKSQDGGERVYKVVDEEKLSLAEVIRTASQSAAKNAQDGDWDKARARWKEIVQSKPSVVFMMDEAQWGLVLGDALQSALPDSTKKKLKQVNESYLAEINHEEIAQQVKRLLDEISEVKLQRELKKLANRSWERDKLAGHLTGSQPVQTIPPESAPTPGETPKVLPGLATKPVGDPAGSPAGNPAAIPHEGPTGFDGVKVSSQVDSLASQGKYMAALKAMDADGAQSWTQKKREIGERFCEEKRTLAANAFKDFKKATSDSVKAVLLQHTAGYLDSCLFYFPDLAISPKVRKNREMVETEMKKLKP